MTKTLPDRTLVFHGEMDVEDDAFSCVVERLIINEGYVSIQMACIDEGGPHVAEGSFELESGFWQTRRFTIEYKGDPLARPASFKLSKLKISPDHANADIQADWWQAGESFEITGTLELLQSK